MLMYKIINKKMCYLLPIFLLTSGCFDKDSGLLYSCKTTLLSEKSSPKNTFIISHYERDCGATTDFATSVSIRQSNQEFKDDVNDTIVVIKGRATVESEWMSESVVKIKSSSIFFRKEERWKNITITYDKISKDKK